MCDFVTAVCTDDAHILLLFFRSWCQTKDVCAKRGNRMKGRPVALKKQTCSVSLSYLLTLRGKRGGIFALVFIKQIYYVFIVTAE